MPISFSTPDDVPYGCFHPASRYQAFRVDGTYWSSVAQYCLAQELVSAEDRERVRMQARDPGHAIELARDLPRVPDTAARALAALPLALRLSFESNLGVRAVPVATGEEPIEARLGDDAVLGVGLDGRGANLLRLERDDYHPEHCRFPLGFFELDGRTLLVHATEWNRLDVCDPRTGARVTERPSPVYGDGQSRPPHYLDYFHAGLLISPDGRRVVDNGWIWHPWGDVRVFDLHRWVTTNPWESEDGPSLHTLCGRSNYWDGPVAWLDDRRVAVWGEGEDDTELIAAALIFDAETGEELSRFHGPAEGFAAVAGQLIAFDRRGTSVWDPTTGERVHHDDSFTARAAHPRSGELISISGAAFRVSRLVTSASTWPSGAPA